MKFWKRIISFVLLLTMMLSYLPADLFAFALETTWDEVVNVGGAFRQYPAAEQSGFNNGVGLVYIVDRFQIDKEILEKYRHHWYDSDSCDDDQMVTYEEAFKIYVDYQNDNPTSNKLVKLNLNSNSVWYGYNKYVLCFGSHWGNGSTFSYNYTLDDGSKKRYSTSLNPFGGYAGSGMKGNSPMYHINEMHMIGWQDSQYGTTARIYSSNTDIEENKIDTTKILPILDWRNKRNSPVTPKSDLLNNIREALNSGKDIVLVQNVCNLLLWYKAQDLADLGSDAVLVFNAMMRYFDNVNGYSSELTQEQLDILSGKSTSSNTVKGVQYYIYMPDYEELDEVDECLEFYFITYSPVISTNYVVPVEKGEVGPVNNPRISVIATPLSALLTAYPSVNSTPMINGIFKDYSKSGKATWISTADLVLKEHTEIPNYENSFLQYLRLACLHGLDTIGFKVSGWDTTPTVDIINGSPIGTKILSYDMSNPKGLLGVGAIGPNVLKAVEPVEQKVTIQFILSDEKDYSGDTVPVDKMNEYGTISWDSNNNCVKPNSSNKNVYIFDDDASADMWWNAAEGSEYVAYASKVTQNGVTQTVELPSTTIQLTELSFHQVIKNINDDCIVKIYLYKKEVSQNTVKATAKVKFVGDSDYTKEIPLDIVNGDKILTNTVDSGTKVPAQTFKDTLEVEKSDGTIVSVKFANKANYDKDGEAGNWTPKSSSELLTTKEMTVSKDSKLILYYEEDDDSEPNKITVTQKWSCTNTYEGDTPPSMTVEFYKKDGDSYVKMNETPKALAGEEIKIVVKAKNKNRINSVNCDNANTKYNVAWDIGLDTEYLYTDCVSSKRVAGYQNHNKDVEITFKMPAVPINIELVVDRKHFIVLNPYILTTSGSLVKWTPSFNTERGYDASHVPTGKIGWATGPKSETTMSDWTHYSANPVDLWCGQAAIPLCNIDENGMLNGEQTPFHWTKYVLNASTTDYDCPEIVIDDPAERFIDTTADGAKWTHRAWPCWPQGLTAADAHEWQVVYKEVPTDKPKLIVVYGEGAEDFKVVINDEELDKTGTFGDYTNCSIVSAEGGTDVVEMIKGNTYIIEVLADDSYEDITATPLESVFEIQDSGPGCYNEFTFTYPEDKNVIVIRIDGKGIPTPTPTYSIVIHDETKNRDAEVSMSGTILREDNSSISLETDAIVFDENNTYTVSTDCVKKDVVNFTLKANSLTEDTIPEEGCWSNTPGLATITADSDSMTYNVKVENYDDGDIHIYVTDKNPPTESPADYIINVAYRFDTISNTSKASEFSYVKYNIYNNDEVIESGTASVPANGTSTISIGSDVNWTKLELFGLVKDGNITVGEISDAPISKVYGIKSWKTLDGIPVTKATLPTDNLSIADNKKLVIYPWGDGSQTQYVGNTELVLDKRTYNVVAFAKDTYEDVSDINTLFTDTTLTMYGPSGVGFTSDNESNIVHQVLHYGDKVKLKATSVLTPYATEKNRLCGNLMYDFTSTLNITYDGNPLTVYHDSSNQPSLPSDGINDFEFNVRGDTIIKVQTPTIPDGVPDPDLKTLKVEFSMDKDFAVDIKYMLDGSQVVDHFTAEEYKSGLLYEKELPSNTVVTIDAYCANDGLDSHVSSIDIYKPIDAGTKSGQTNNSQDDSGNYKDPLTSSITIDNDVKAVVNCDDISKLTILESPTGKNNVVMTIGANTYTVGSADTCDYRFGQEISLPTGTRVKLKNTPTDPFNVRPFDGMPAATIQGGSGNMPNTTNNTCEIEFTLQGNGQIVANCEVETYKINVEIIPNGTKDVVISPSTSNIISGLNSYTYTPGEVLTIHIKDLPDYESYQLVDFTVKYKKSGVVNPYGEGTPHTVFAELNGGNTDTKGLIVRGGITPPDSDECKFVMPASDVVITVNTSGPVPPPVQAVADVQFNLSPDGAMISPAEGGFELTSTARIKFKMPFDEDSPVSLYNWKQGWFIVGYSIYDEVADVEAKLKFGQASAPSIYTTDGSTINLDFKYEEDEDGKLVCNMGDFKENGYFGLNFSNAAEIKKFFSGSTEMSLNMTFKSAMTRDEIDDAKTNRTPYNWSAKGAATGFGVFTDGNGQYLIVSTDNESTSISSKTGFYAHDWYWDYKHHTVCEENTETTFPFLGYMVPGFNIFDKSTYSSSLTKGTEDKNEYQYRLDMGVPEGYINAHSTTPSPSCSNYNSFPAEEDSATWVWTGPQEVTVSSPPLNAYAEIKANECRDEDWNVLAGIPSTENLSVMCGGTLYKYEYTKSVYTRGSRNSSGSNAGEGTPMGNAEITRTIGLKVVVDWLWGIGATGDANVPCHLSCSWHTDSTSGGHPYSQPEAVTNPAPVSGTLAPGETFSQAWTITYSGLLPFICPACKCETAAIKPKTETGTWTITNPTCGAHNCKTTGASCESHSSEPIDTDGDGEYDSQRPIPCDSQCSCKDISYSFSETGSPRVQSHNCTWTQTVKWNCSTGESYVTHSGGCSKCRPQDVEVQHDAPPTKANDNYGQQKLGTISYYLQNGGETGKTISVTPADMEVDLIDYGYTYEESYGCKCNNTKNCVHKNSTSQTFTIIESVDMYVYTQLEKWKLWGNAYDKITYQDDELFTDALDRTATNNVTSLVWRGNGDADMNAKTGRLYFSTWRAHGGAEELYTDPHQIMKIVPDPRYNFGNCTMTIYAAANCRGIPDYQFGRGYWNPEEETRHNGREEEHYSSHVSKEVTDQKYRYELIEDAGYTGDIMTQAKIDDYCVQVVNYYQDMNNNYGNDNLGDTYRTARNWVWVMSDYMGCGSDDIELGYQNILCMAYPVEQNGVKLFDTEFTKDVKTHYRNHHSDYPGATYQAQMMDDTTYYWDGYNTLNFQDKVYGVDFPVIETGYNGIADVESYDDKYNTEPKVQRRGWSAMLLNTFETTGNIGDNAEGESAANDAAEWRNIHYYFGNGNALWDNYRPLSSAPYTKYIEEDNFEDKQSGRTRTRFFIKDEDIASLQEVDVEGYYSKDNLDTAGVYRYSYFKEGSFYLQRQVNQDEPYQYEGNVLITDYGKKNYDEYGVSLVINNIDINDFVPNGVYGKPIEVTANWVPMSSDDKSITKELTQICNYTEGYVSEEPGVEGTEVEMVIDGKTVKKKHIINDIVIHDPISVQYSYVIPHNVDNYMGSEDGAYSYSYLDYRIGNTIRMKDTDGDFVMKQVDMTLVEEAAKPNFAIIGKPITLWWSDMASFENGVKQHLDEAKDTLWGTAGDKYEKYTGSYNSGSGFGDNMDTGIWTKSRWVKFPFAVCYRGINGEWVPLEEDTWINLAGVSAFTYKDGERVDEWNKPSGMKHEDFYASVCDPLIDYSIDSVAAKGYSDDYHYGIQYEFYIPTSTEEDEIALIEYCAIANNSEFTNPEEGSNYEDAECNQERLAGEPHASYSIINKTTKLALVGNIGGLTVEDTGDYRFSNLFKQPIEGSWLIDNIVLKVDESSLNTVLVDGLTANAAKDEILSFRSSLLKSGKINAGKYSVDGTGVSTLPIRSALNNIHEFRMDELKAGYKIIADLETLGNYYGLNYKTNSEGEKKLYFGPTSAREADDRDYGIEITPVYMLYDPDTKEFIHGIEIYSGAPGSRTLSYPSLTDEISSSIVEFQNTEARRNVSIGEKEITQLVMNAYASDKNTSALDDNNDYIGNMSKLFLDAKNRTYVGSPYKFPYMEYDGAGNLIVRESDWNALTGKAETNTGALSNVAGYDDAYPTEGSTPNLSALAFAEQAQRWHFSLSLPSSSYLTYSLNNTGNQYDIEQSHKTLIAEHPDAVLVAFLIIKAKGDTWELCMTNSGTMSDNRGTTVNVPTYFITDENGKKWDMQHHLIPFAFFDTEETSEVDWGQTGTH